MICASRSDTQPFLFQLSEGGFPGWHSQVFDHIDGGSGADDGGGGGEVMETLISIL